MRLTTILLVAIAGLVACNKVAAAPSDSAPEKISEAAALDKATLSRELAANDHGGRFLRTQGGDNDSLDPDKKDDSDDEEDDDDKDEEDDDDKDEEGEDRDLIIPTLNRFKYRRWFRAHMTPHDVKEVMGLTGLRPLVKPIKRRVYKGYVVYYEEHCRRPQYSSMRFCQPDAEE